MDEAFRITPFAFDRIFTSPKTGAGPTGFNDADQVIVLRAELELLRAQSETASAVARADGFEAGLAQARDETASALLAATDALHASIETIEGEFTVIEERISKAAAGVAMAAADGLAGRALHTDPTLAIDEAIARVLTQVARGQELQIRVHPSLFEGMAGLIAHRQDNERRRLALTLIPDESLAVGDALISWEQGGLALDAAARRAAIIAELGLDDPATP
jgi:flagellar assembly protein FliH